jgi:hypothetical protein
MAGSRVGVILRDAFQKFIVSWAGHVLTWKEVKREECHCHKLLVLDLCIEKY